MPDPSKKPVCLVFVGRGIVSPYIGEDILLAFRKNGFSSEVLPLTNNLQVIQEKIDQFRPDLILSLDGKGLEFEPVKNAGCRRVAWFVDHPFYFDSTQKLNRDDDIFVWDETYISDLKRCGFNRVSFLPLATNPERFQSLTLSDQDREKYGADLSFIGTVGKSYEELKAEHAQKYPAAAQGLMDQIFKIGTYLYDPDKSEEAGRMLGELKNQFDQKLQAAMEYILDLQLDAFRRHGLLERMAGYPSALYGNEFLKKFQKNKAVYRGSISYQEELSKAFQGSKITVNSTRPQLRMTVNQRIFDGFSCGTFVLSDYRPFLKAVLPFDPKLICFKDFNEFQEKAEYYLGHPDERIELTRLAQREIRAKHTYECRIRTLLETLNLAERVSV